MVAAMITVCGMWSLVWCLGRKLSGTWGVLVPCALLPVLAMMEISLDTLRLLVMGAMLVTLVMLFNRHLRHYILVPSCMAPAGGPAAMSLNFNLLN